MLVPPRPLTVLQLLLAFATVLTVAVCSEAQEKKNSPPEKTETVLMRVTTRASKTYVGHVIENSKTSVRFFDIVGNEPIEIEKADVKAIVNPLSFDDAVKSVGLPRLLSWKIGLLAKKMRSTGKVARVTAQVVYVTLGSSSGVRVGTAFSVYRNEGEIKDPLTGAVIGVERPTVSTLEVTEVEANFSKAKITSNLEIPIQVGDEVESKDDLVVAVCPIRNEDGELSNVGSKLSEEITTSLVQAGINVVERSVLDSVLPELIIQNTILFDPKSAQKLGELTGAKYVVTGKIVPGRSTGTAFIRLVDVQSASILLAASTNVNVKSAMVAPVKPATSIADRPPVRDSRPNREVRDPRDSRMSKAKPNPPARIPAGTFEQGRIPSYMTTTSTFSQTPRKGIVLERDGSIISKDVNFLDRDFKFDVLVDTSLSNAVTNIGLGQKDRDRVMIRIHSPKHGNGEGQIRLNDELIGHITSTGTNRVTISKSRDTVIFQIDVGNDGSTDDDIETIIHDIRAYVPAFHSKNVALILNGGGEFFSCSLK